MCQKQLKELIKEVIENIKFQESQKDKSIIYLVTSGFWVLLGW
jgi:hypothetical protein